MIQHTGDAIFVPAGWHHQVLNLEDTLSLNHNWLNAHSLHWTWDMLRRDYDEAVAAIEDCRELCEEGEFEQLCQVLAHLNLDLDFRR